MKTEIHSNEFSSFLIILGLILSDISRSEVSAYYVILLHNHSTIVSFTAKGSRVELNECYFKMMGVNIYCYAVIFLDAVVSQWVRKMRFRIKSDEWSAAALSFSWVCYPETSADRNKIGSSFSWVRYSQTSADRNKIGSFTTPRSTVA